MHDVLVIGAGFWGTAIALALRQAGREVLCLDSAEKGAASPVAAGLVRQTTLESLEHKRPAPWWSVEHSHACHEFLRTGCRQGWVSRCPERILSSFCPQGRPRQDLWCTDVARLLSRAQPQAGRVVSLVRSPDCWTAHTDEQAVEARQVVVAAGFLSDRLLAASRLSVLGLLPMPGSALLAPTPRPLLEAVTLAFRLPGDSRTRTATALPWGPGQIRAGDTVEPQEPLQLTRLASLLESLGAVGPTTRLWGIRPHLPSLQVELIQPDLVVASGGRRNGLATAAGAALRVVQLLAQ